MELHDADPPVQVLHQALPIFQVPELFLVVLILRVHPEKGECLSNLVQICGTEGEFQTQVVLELFIQQVIRVLGNEIDTRVHGAPGTDQLHGEGLSLRDLQKAPGLIEVHDLENAPVRLDEIEGKGADDDQHGDRQKLHRGILGKSALLVRQHEIRHLDDVQLFVQADGLVDVPVGE